MRKLVILIGVVGLVTTRLLAQDPVFSQFYNSAVYLNPALVGEEEDLYLNFSHRSQWRSLQFPYTTYQVSMIAPFYTDKHIRPEGHIGGIGVSLLADEAGEAHHLKTYGGNVSFAYNLQFDNVNTNRLTFAVQAGVIHKRVDKDKLEWGEQYDAYTGFDGTITPAELDMIEPRTILDITAGAFWRYYADDQTRTVRSTYAGLVGAHLNHPDQSVTEEENRLPLLYKLHGGVVFGLSERTSISANFLTLVQDKENQTNLGTFLSYKMPFETMGMFNNLVTRVGGWYRINDSAIASIEFLTNNLHIGFSYDWNVSSLTYHNRGAASYEISLGYRFFKPAAPKIRY